MRLAGADGGPFARDRLRYFAGMLATAARAREPLQCILADVLPGKVEVHEFHGRWLRLDRDQQARLGARRAAGLGDVVLGWRAWSPSAAIEVRIVGLDWPSMSALLPVSREVEGAGDGLLDGLANFLRVYLGPTVEVKLTPQPDPSAIAPARLAGRTAGARNVLGESAYLLAGTRPRDRATGPQVWLSRL